MQSHRPLRIGGVPEHFNLPFHLLLEDGGTAAFGWRDYPGGTGAMLAALDADEIDLALVLTEGAAAYLARGGQAVVPGLWVASPLVWGIHTGAASPYHTLADLRGKPFAISRKGSGSQLMAYLLARQEGWPAETVSFVEVGNLAGAVQALAHVEAAGFLWERFTTHPLVADGTFRRLGDLPAPWPAFAVAVRPDVWAERSAQVVALMEQALDKACVLAASAEAPALFATRYGLAADQAAAWLAQTRWAYPWAQMPTQPLLADVTATLRDVGAVG